jgi:hypothetical protein
MKLKRYSRSNSSDNSSIVRSVRRQKIRRSQFNAFDETVRQEKKNEMGPSEVPPSLKYDTSVKGSNHTRITVKMIPSKES